MAASNIVLQARQDLGLSQSELAELLSVSTQTVRAADNADMSIADLARIVETL